MTASLPAVFNVQLLTDMGAPASGFRLYTYSPGTTVHKIAYTDAAASVPHTYTSDGIGGQYIALNARGELPASLYLTAGGYDLALKTAAGASVWTRRAVGVDDVTAGFAGSAGSSLVGFTQSGTGAVATTVQAKARQTVSVFDFMTAAQIAEVQAGTAALDVSDAIRAAINSFSEVFDNYYYSSGGTVIFPVGRYYCASTIQINRQVRLVGAGAPAGNNSGSCELAFADNIDGLVINTYAYPTAGKTDASGALIEGFTIARRKNTGGTGGVGILMRARATVRNCMLLNWRSHGIKIDASTGYTPPSNANNWYLENVRLLSNGGHGLYVLGADANAGLALGVDASSNTGRGIYDQSFLGNTYVGCHTASNVAGSYAATDANARNMFLGCYSEGGEPDPDIRTPSMVVGGILGAYDLVGGAPSLDAGLGYLRLRSATFSPLKAIYFGECAKSADPSTMDAYLEGSWTPTATGLTVVGTASYAGRYTRVGNRVHFDISVSVAGGTTASTAGTSYVTLPIAPIAKAACVACSDASASYGAGLVDTTSRVYLPTWAATGNTVRVSGAYECSSSV